MKKRLIIILCLLLVVIYVGFKFYCYKKYEASDNRELSNVKITGKMSVNHIDLKDSEYIIFNNLKFKNIFKGYERLNENTDIYKMILKDENDNIIKAIFIGSDDQYVYIINNNKEYSDLSNILKKKNIQDDVDFVKYMESHNDEVKFFMTLKKQKEIYSVNEFKLVMLPSIEYVKEVDGYFRGYIFKTSKSITEVNILDDNKKYYFTFFGDYSEEDINDFMNSVIINK